MREVVGQLRSCPSRVASGEIALQSTTRLLNPQIERRSRGSSARSETREYSSWNRQM